MILLQLGDLANEQPSELLYNRVTLNIKIYAKISITVLSCIAVAVRIIIIIIIFFIVITFI